MRNRGSWLIGAIALAFLAWGATFVIDYFDRGSIAHVAIQDWLTWFGQSVYEYHSKAGNWPESFDDLGQTSLTATFPLWKSTAENIVMLWPKNLNKDPKENGSVILGYYNRGCYLNSGGNGFYGVICGPSTCLKTICGCD